MTSISVELKTIRQQVERLQAEAAGRKQLASMTVWEEHNNDYVNQISERFNGLIIHLTTEVSPSTGTAKCQKGMSQNEFKELRKQIIESLDTPTSSSVY